MNKYYIFFFITLRALSSFGQSVTEFKFVYSGPTPSCNPFIDNKNSFTYPYSYPWEVSHGTPGLKDPYGGINYSVAELRGRYLQVILPKRLKGYLLVIISPLQRVMK
jgi:hypothetical protein